MDVVKRLHEEFLMEAQNSPILLNDLASMEKYIAESYAGRSLIELLQNADDAGATKFYIEKLKNNIYLVANNGRKFEEQDLYALCRSGASTKRRKMGTIGFRGIGFKSVVNFSQTVHLISGNIKTTFSKEETQKEILNIENAPLIRIPHIFNGFCYDTDIQKVFKDGYTTVFIFESKNNELEKEIQRFDISCMIFLRKLTEIIYCSDIKKVWKTFITKKANNSKVVRCFNGEEENSWLVFSDKKNFPCDIAFYFANGKSINAPIEKAVVHSFMPTNDRLSIPIKINGDFSTDPSRTKVTLDDETIQSINMCGNLISDIIVDLLESEKDDMNIVKVISKGKIDSLSNIRGKSISDFLIEKIYDNIKKYIKNISMGKSVYYQQDGISDSDFQAIIKNIDAIGIGNEKEIKIPGLIDFLKNIGITPIPTDKILDAMQSIKCEKNTRISVFASVIQESRLGISENTKLKIKKAKLVEFESGVKRIGEQEASDRVEESYQGAVIERLGSSSNFEWFSRQMNIPLSDKRDKVNDTMKEVSKNISFSNHITKKWRSAEENFLQFMQNLQDVDMAIDVSANNLGYDVEVILKNGEHEYYEIKSVNRIGEPFSMTNNEFSSAIQYEEKFNLAVIQQDKDRFYVCIINNPANSLILTKRITRWEWYCNNYSGKVLQAEMGE